jgi:hypothetical protein
VRTLLCITAKFRSQCLSWLIQSFALSGRVRFAERSVKPQRRPTFEQLPDGKWRLIAPLPAAPWTVEETAPCFIVRDANKQALASVYYEKEPDGAQPQAC